MKNIISKLYLGLGIIALAAGLSACGSDKQQPNNGVPAPGGFTPQGYPTAVQTPYTYYGAGQCPVGYSQSGYQCAPNTNGNVVCPGGYTSNGYGCIPSNWQCPSSYQCMNYGGGYNNYGGGGYNYGYSGYYGYGNTTQKYCYLTNWGWVCN